MNIPWKRIASIFLTTLLSALSPAARGGEGGITVSGTGEVLAKPTRVEIDLAAGAAAELTGDAIVKYENSLRRTLDVFKKMELKNLKIEQRSLSFESTSGSAAAANAFAAGDGAPSTAKSQIDITRSLRVVLTETDKLSEQELLETIGRLLDAAKDAGAKIGSGATNALMMRMMGEAAASTPVVTFVVEDAAAAREKAYQAAFNQAKALRRAIGEPRRAAVGPRRVGRRGRRDRPQRRGRRPGADDYGHLRNLFQVGRRGLATDLAEARRYSGAGDVARAIRTGGKSDDRKSMMRAAESRCSRIFVREGNKKCHCRTADFESCSARLRLAALYLRLPRRLPP